MIIVAIIIILIILKFIYDSYLTDNTESRYKEYKSTEFGIRADGIYVFTQKGVSTWKEKFVISHVLVFNTHGLVAYMQLDELDEAQTFKPSSGNQKPFIDNLVSEMNEISKQENGIGRYERKGNNVEIIINGNKNPDRENWIERNLDATIFKGNLDHNNLFLDTESVYFDQTLGFNIKKIFVNQKFTFFQGSEHLKHLTNNLQRIDSSSEEHKQSKKADQKIDGLESEVEDMKELSPHEILEWEQSKWFQDLNKWNRSAEAELKLRFDRNRIKMYFKHKELHNTLKKGTVVEYTMYDYDFAPPQITRLEIGMVISITEFTGNPYEDKAVVKFQNGSTKNVSTISLKLK
jgi:hypothetical protein